MPKFLRLRSAFLYVVVALNFTRFIGRHSRPRGDGRSLVPGPDPIRVLVFGSGLGVGYGVREERLALSGQLAQLLAKQLRRGVVVERRAAPGYHASRDVAVLGPNGAHTYRAAVYMPALTDIASGSSAAWQRELEALLAHLRQTGGEHMPIVFTGLPFVTNPSRLERPGVEPLLATNRHIMAVSDSDACVDYVEMPSIETLLISAKAFDADYYGRCAERIVDALVPRLKGV